MSKSSTETGVLAWLRERFPITLFVPVVLFLALPAFSAVSVAVAFLLVLQFRLWDDLVDRERDRDRVLGRARTLVPFYVFFAVLTVAVLVLAFKYEYLMALGALALWYRWIARLVHPVLRYHVVLLKYPLFTYLAASAGIGAMALAYTTFIAYEPLHDRSVRWLPVTYADLGAWLVVVVHATIFTAISAAVVAAMAVWHVHRGEDGTLTGRALFVVSFAALFLSEGVLS